MPTMATMVAIAVDVEETDNVAFGTFNFVTNCHKIERPKSDNYYKIITKILNLYYRTVICCFCKKNVVKLNK